MGGRARTGAGSSGHQPAAHLRCCGQTLSAQAIATSVATQCESILLHSLDMAMGTPLTSQEQGTSKDSICWFPQLPPDLLVYTLSHMGLEGHHMSRATSIRFSRAYGGEHGVWVRLYLLHFLSEGVTLSESFTWQQAEQRYNQHLREPVLNALSKIAPGSVREGSSFMRAGQEFEKYEDLNLSRCRCNSLPHGVWSIQTLVRLNLSYCSLRELSPGITQLVNLKALDLQHNNFSALPEGCGELKSLTGLNIQNCNNLVSLPDLSALPNLEIIGVPTWLFEWELSGKKAYNMMTDGFPSQPIELNFRNFQGSSLPEGISKLTNLDEQSMKGILAVCKSMTKLPEDLFEHPYFSALTGLDFSNWKMQS